MSRNNQPKGVKYGGRQKGTPNKFTASVKAAFEEAFVRMGGVDALVAWGKENPTDFYKLFARLLPQQHNISAPGAVSVQIQYESFSLESEESLDAYSKLLAGRPRPGSLVPSGPSASN